jgi:hypothetical protein
MHHLEITEVDRRRWMITGQTSRHSPSVPELVKYARDRWQYARRRRGVTSTGIIRDDAGKIVTQWEWRRV